MRRIIKILVIQIIAIILFINYCNAASDGCKINLSSDKSILNPGDEISINVLMSNITVNDGIVLLSSVLNYPSNVFDIVIDETDEALDKVAEFVTDMDLDGDIEMLYLGEKDTSMATKSTWDVIYCDVGAEDKGIVAYSEEKQKDTQVIAKLKFKVKDEAPKCDTEISLKDITVYDEQEQTYEANEAKISFSINGIDEGNDVEEDEDVDIDIVDEEDDETNIIGDDTANEDVPYTGIEDYIPALAIIIAMGIFSYINYRKYKNI